MKNAGVPKPELNILRTYVAWNPGKDWALHVPETARETALSFDQRLVLDELAGRSAAEWAASGAGYVVLDVGPDGVAADVYSGDSKAPCRHVIIR